MLTLMLGFPNITPIADDAEITYIDLMLHTCGGGPRYPARFEGTNPPRTVAEQHR